MKNRTVVRGPLIALGCNLFVVVDIVRFLPKYSTVSLILQPQNHINEIPPLIAISCQQLLHSPSVSGNERKVKRVRATESLEIPLCMLPLAGSS